mmetsp:Transcript_37679/g.99673  ORF Transcript_37679/g.99673 Transcript_37679/m.99673 type:complete len:422 (+) Transcript_37679:437-1702(+)
MSRRGRVLVGVSCAALAVAWLPAEVHQLRGRRHRDLLLHGRRRGVLPRVRRRRRLHVVGVVRHPAAAPGLHERLVRAGVLLLKVVLVVRLVRDLPPLGAAAAARPPVGALALHHEVVQAAEDAEQAHQRADRVDAPGHAAPLLRRCRCEALDRSGGRVVRVGRAVVLDVLALRPGRVLGRASVEGQGVLDLQRGIGALVRAPDGPVHEAAGGQGVLPVLAADVRVAPRLAALHAEVLVSGHELAHAVEVEHLQAGEVLQDPHVAVHDALRALHRDRDGVARARSAGVAEANPALPGVGLVVVLPHGTPRVAPAPIHALLLRLQVRRVLQSRADAGPALLRVVKGRGLPALPHRPVHPVARRRPRREPLGLGSAGPRRVAGRGGGAGEARHGHLGRNLLGQRHLHAGEQEDRARPQSVSRHG